jgi:hypothetical protein
LSSAASTCGGREESRPAGGTKTSFSADGAGPVRARVLNLHKTNIQENAEPLTEGKLLLDVQGEEKTDDDIGCYFFFGEGPNQRKI